MSTEHQQFSIENQMAIIAEYAASHDFDVVRTYSDEARSGIDLAHRPGLKQLLDDVTNSKADYRAELVYDVSRWGRFQDADESACYEFLCRRAGVSVIYCAEPFANDLGVMASLVKTLKRTMAAEYLRELSAKVFAGQCRLIPCQIKVHEDEAQEETKSQTDSERRPFLKPAKRQPMAPPAALER
jgi:DNA invertase Pin-like site-specific DNA recombinase